MITWAVTLTPEGATMISLDRSVNVVAVRAYFCNIRDGCLVFTNIDEATICTFAPAYWVMAEREKPPVQRVVYEDEEMHK